MSKVFVLLLIAGLGVIASGCGGSQEGQRVESDAAATEAHDAAVEDAELLHRASQQ